MKYWVADCPRCGQVSVKQESKPTSCRVEFPAGLRSNRRCGRPLTNQQDMTRQVAEEV